MIQLEDLLKKGKNQCERDFFKDEKTDEEIKNTSFKRSNFYDVHYKNCSFVANSMAGSSLSKCTFENTRICDSGFTSSNLTNVDFFSDSKVKFVGNNFSNCMFLECNWKNIHNYGSAILDAIFQSNSFENCIFESVTLESTIFKNCSFVNVDFRISNVEFVEFKSCCLSNVVFPILQFPYIFGIAELVENNSIKFYDKEEIDMTTYLSLFPQLKERFLEKGEYFPVCNILICLKEYQEASEYLMIGIAKSIEKQNFRMISYFCKLGLTYDLITSQYASKIMDLIDGYMIKNNLNEIQMKNLILYSSKIRGQLFNINENKTNLQFTIKTNISSTNSKSISELLDLINLFLSNDAIGKNKNYIEIRHNSPFEIFINIIQNTADILFISQAFISLIRYYLKKRKQHRKVNLQNIIEKTISETNLEIEKDYHKRLDLLNANDKKMLIKKTIEKYSTDIKMISEKNKANKNQLIDSITQKIIGEIDEILPQNLYIFKIENLEED